MTLREIDIRLSQFKEMLYLSELCDHPKIVYYPGCGTDLTPVYLLDAKTFIYQDIGDWPFPDRPMNEGFSQLLRGFSKKGLVENLKIKRSGNKFTFETMKTGDAGFAGKRLLELYHGHEKGDMNKYTPRKARKADITYLENLNLSITIVPNLKTGSIIRSSTTIDSPWYFDLPKNPDMELFGIRTILIDDKNNRAIFRKVKQVSHEEIKRLKRNTWLDQLHYNKNLDEIDRNQIRACYLS